MDDVIRAKLRNRLGRSDRENLLSGSATTLAEVVRENLGPAHKREAGYLNAVMQAGAPARLLSMPAAGLTQSTLGNYAKQISDETGLREDIARWAIEAWAFSLGLQIVGGEHQQEEEIEKTAGDVAKGGTGDDRDTSDSGLKLASGRSSLIVYSSSARAQLVLGVALIGQSFIQILGCLYPVTSSGGPLPTILRFYYHLSSVVGWCLFVGAINIFAMALGISLILRQRWVAPWGIIVCGVAVVLNLMLVQPAFNAFVNSGYVGDEFLVTLWIISIIAGFLLHAITLFQLWHWRNAIGVSHVSSSQRATG
jgi:hypothetical protein